MPSPFPGMDPYLESPAFWSDFHSTFVNYWREAIVDLLPDEYDATIGERVYLIDYDPDARRLAYPDIAISGREGRSRTPDTPAVVATLEPVTIPLTLLDGPRESYIEILHLPDRSLVTALELLSPANKTSANRIEYLAKRRALLNQEVHLVELDLLLGGARLPMDRALPTADYYYFVSRSELRPDCQVYSWTVRDRLPTLPVPLRTPDPDLQIDLAQVFTTTYERGRFGRRLRYGEPFAAAEGPKRDWIEQSARSRVNP